MEYRTTLYPVIVVVSFGFVITTCLKTLMGEHKMEYTMAYFEVPLDHFGNDTRGTTFKIKYFYNDAFWRKPGGPIFFANGGHRDTPSTDPNFMTQIAEEFGAMIVIMEHRFHGDSVPETYSREPGAWNEYYNNDSMLQYLTMEQTLADSASLLLYLKNYYSADSSPVIAFGCSYTATLSTYFRMQYPNVVTGAIASSAMINYSRESCDLLPKALMEIYSKDYPNCGQLIRHTWAALERVANTSEGRVWIEKNWNLCYPLGEPSDWSYEELGLSEWLRKSGIYNVMARKNYLYSTSTYKDLPAYPVMEFCKKLTRNGTLGLAENDTTILTHFLDGVNMFYNYSGKKDCFDQFDRRGILYGSETEGTVLLQACSELILWTCSDGVNDIYFPTPLVEETKNYECGHGVISEPEKLHRIFSVQNLLGSSNILFSDGQLDPWYTNGFMQNLSDTLLAVNIKDAAACLDMSASNPADPAGVLKAREFEKQVIRQWIQEYRQAKASN